MQGSYDIEARFSDRGLIRLMLPLVIEQLLAVSVGLADTVMVSGVGEHAVSAISLVDSLNFLLIQLFSALATGGAVVAAQYIGRADRKNACETARQLTYSTTLIAVLLAAVAIALNGPILRLIYGSLDAAVMENARRYFFLSALSYPFLALYNAGAALFRSMGNSRVSMLASLAMNAVNVAGNAVLIYGFHLGVVGAGAATLVSRALAAVIVTRLLADPHNEIYLDRLLHIDFKPGIVRSILRVGVPNGLENSIFQVGKLIVAGLVSTFGTTAIASNAICNSINGFVCVPGNAIGLGLITVVGQCMGAGRSDLARRYVRKLMLWIHLCSGALCLGLFVFAGQVLRIYNLTPESLEMSRTVIRWFAVFQTFTWPTSFPFPNALRAAGDARFTMIVSMVSMWLCRVGLCYVFTYVPFFARLFPFPLLGVFFAMFVDWIFRDAFFLTRWAGGKWEKHALI